MVQVLIAGYGNPLRRDHGAGWRVAERADQRWGNGIRVLVGQQPVPEWALELARASDTDQPMLDSHTFGPSHLLALARSLYGCAPEAYLVELPAEDLGFGESLSAGTARAVERVGRYLDRRLASILSRPAPRG
jgi:Ni,Fe-hydrogenase maturation factor